MRKSLNSRGFTIAEVAALLGVTALLGSFLVPSLASVGNSDVNNSTIAVSSSNIVVAEPETLPVEEILVNITNTTTGVTLSRTVAPGVNTATFTGLDPQGNYTVEVVNKSQAGKSPAVTARVEYGQHPTLTRDLVLTRPKLVSALTTRNTTPATEAVRNNYSVNEYVTYNNYSVPANTSTRRHQVVNTTWDTCYSTCYSTCYYYDSWYGWVYYSCNPYNCNPYSCNPRHTVAVQEIANPGNASVKLASYDANCAPGEIKTTTSQTVRVHAGYYTSRNMNPATWGTSWDVLLENSSTSWINGSGGYYTYTVTSNASNGEYTMDAGYRNIVVPTVTCTAPAVYEDEEYTVQESVNMGITTVKEVNAPAGQLVIEVASNPRRSFNWASGTVVAVGAGVSGYTKGETVQFRNGTVFTFDGKQYLRVPAQSFLVKK
jgi:hypothetical protein